MTGAVCVAGMVLVLMCGEPPAGEVPSLAALDAKVAEVTSLRAAFEREKHSALLLEPLVSSGRVTAKEGKVRWDTLKPRESVVIIAEGKITAREGNGQAESHEVPAALMRLTASPKLQFSALGEAFVVTVRRGRGAESEEDRVLIGLEPSEEELQRFVTSVKLELDPETAIASRIEYADPDGDRTVLRFTKVEINPEISESLFDVDRLR